eukprot:TRINITY_DN88104_c0_g1_i1.p1 TRINITY_DN88104_c0_g1~~TRINITY_DN88104_c0_g1_i1.p1  ORF type:complete len:993 (-),score=182.72 TRINITY_DN88104_c0_g1_i1:134-3112(-)
MVGASSIDDLFRQKSLQEIHGILQQTRLDVEAKKTELRELVGDHYRSVLESSDHIRAMFDCAARVSSGSVQVEKLISSMRELASSPPVLATGIATSAETGDCIDADDEYRLGSRMMELLELPEAVHCMLGDQEFVTAARTAVIEASALQQEVDRLLNAVQLDSQPAIPGCDLRALAKQQATVHGTLPKQVASGCLDAFGSASLTPTGAAEAFVVHLLLDDTMRQGQLLRCFVDRRSELLRDLLESQATESCNESCTSRLLAAAMAFEGTVILSSGLCSSGPGGALPPVLEVAVKSLADRNKSWKDVSGISNCESSFESFQHMVERVASSLKQQSMAANSLATELSKLGTAFIRTWAPEDDVDAESLRSLAACFRRLVSSSSGTGPRNCKQLGELQRLFSERLLAYRRNLAAGAGLGTAPEDWAVVWSAASGVFCPGRKSPKDALTCLTSTVEIACANVVRDRVGELKLVFMTEQEEEGSTTHDQGRHGDVEDSRRAEDIAELRKQSHALAAYFDEQLSDILSDVEHISYNGEVPTIVTSALLGALHERLRVAYATLKLPSADPLWPQQPGTSPGKERSWTHQRAAARCALALDALLATATSSGETGKPSAHLAQALQVAMQSGEKSLVKQAEAIVEDLKKRNEEAYCAWARLSAVPSYCTSSLQDFWRLAEDEVQPACGWGSAKFAHQQEADAKAVPVPVQTSAFVLEQLVFAATRALEIAGDTAGLGATLSAASLKAALSESFVSLYEAGQPLDLARLKRSGMSQLLQWLFDLNFLRITLSAGADSGAPAYEKLRDIIAQAESVAFSDPVDRLLYQDVLKFAVNSHVQSTRVLLAPFFLHNPLYNFLSQSPTGTGPSTAKSKASEGDAFELQTSFVLPLRSVLPRFPLLPVAMNAAASLVRNPAGSSDLDRLRLGAQPADRLRHPAVGKHGSGQGDSGAGAAVSSLMQQAGGLVGGGWGGLLTSSWGGGSRTLAAQARYPSSGNTRPPEAV